MEVLKKKEKQREEGLRYFNLRIEGNAISPSTIMFCKESKMSLVLNGNELERASVYWFSLGKQKLRDGDRIEVVAIEHKSERWMKSVDLKVIQVSKHTVRLVELGRQDTRKELSGERRMNQELELEVCPTCHRTI